VTYCARLLSVAGGPFTQPPLIFSSCTLDRAMSVASAQFPRKHDSHAALRVVAKPETRNPKPATTRNR